MIIKAIYTVNKHYIYIERNSYQLSCASNGRLGNRIGWEEKGVLASGLEMY